MEPFRDVTNVAGCSISTEFAICNGSLLSPQKTRSCRLIADVRTPLTQSTAATPDSLCRRWRLPATPLALGDSFRDIYEDPASIPLFPLGQQLPADYDSVIEEVFHEEPAERSRDCERSAWIVARCSSLRREWELCKAARESAGRFQGVVVLSLTRHPKTADRAVRASRLAAGVENPTPAWANGAKVLVPGLGPGEAWEARASFGKREGLGPSHIVVHERDAEAIMEDLRQALPWEDRPTERRSRRIRIPDDQDDELFRDWEAPTSRVVVQQTFITVVPVPQGGLLTRTRSA